MRVLALSQPLFGLQIKVLQKTRRWSDVGHAPKNSSVRLGKV